MKYTSQHCCDKTVDRNLALYRECCFPVGILSYVSGEWSAPPPDPPLLIFHIYWVPCAIARFARVKNCLWVKHLYFLRHLTACYIVSDRRVFLPAKSLIPFLSQVIFLAKACSTYRIARLCSMPPLPETNLLRVLLVLYINFQLLENKRKEQSVSKWRHWLTTSLTSPSRTKF